MQKDWEFGTNWQANSHKERESFLITYTTYSIHGIKKKRTNWTRKA
jgi:hypothetical protein